MSLAPHDATRLERCLAGEGIAVIPTDTVYGLACNPESETAMRRVYELKRRPIAKPAAVMFFSLAAALESLTDLGSRTHAALGALLPGPVTLLLPNPEGRFPLACDPSGGGSGTHSGTHSGTDSGTGSGTHSETHSGTDPGTHSGTLGLRVPVLDGPLTVLAGVSVPVAQSSANLSGGPDPKRLSDVPAALRAGADLVLDGGELPGAASTVIDLSEYERSGSWRIVREGPLGESSVAVALA